MSKLSARRYFDFFAMKKMRNIAWGLAENRAKTKKIIEKLGSDPN